MVFLFAIILIVILIALSWIDVTTFRLPNMLTFPLIAMGVLQSWVLTQDWINSVIGAVIGYLAFVLIEIGFRKLRGKDGLGRGDAKLLAAGGAWCGWMGLPFIVLISSGSALLALLLPSFRKLTDQGKLPFGPFLAVGITCVWLSLKYTNYLG